MARLTKEDWISKGLDLLGKEGYQTIKLETLCLKFGVTRGSFYHHFPGMPEYTLELMKSWESMLTGKLGSIVAQTNDPAQQLQLLIGFVYKISGKTEMAFRMWATHNDIVRAYMEKLDVDRIAITVGVYKGLGLSAEKAQELGHFGHMMWLGLQALHIFNEDKKEQSAAIMTAMFANIRSVLFKK